VGGNDVGRVMRRAIARTKSTGRQCKQLGLVELVDDRAVGEPVEDEPLRHRVAGLRVDVGSAVAVVDELEGKWRVSATVAKTRRARWVPVPETVFEAVVELVPREDRDLDGQVFAGAGADRLRTAIGRACKAAGVPAFSPMISATAGRRSGTSRASRSSRLLRGSGTRRPSI
jgi:hypothetical protein